MQRLERLPAERLEPRWIASQALDLERFTMFTYSPIKHRLDLLTDYVRETTRDGEPLKDDPVVRARMAELHTDAEVARSYPRNEFCRIWLRERGAAYLLLPPSPTTTTKAAAPPANERAPDDPAALAPRAAQRDPA